MASTSTRTTSERLIETLQIPESWPDSVAVTSGVKLIETHISWVLLTDEFAWKIKKPVKFDFLDFSTLKQREHFCHEELRLNRRFAPDLYLDVVTITGSPDRPVIEIPTATSHANHDKPPMEFAVRMRRFDQSQLLSWLADSGQLDASIIDPLADSVAAFHADAEPLTDAEPLPQTRVAPSPSGKNVDRRMVELLAEAVHDNFSSLQERLRDPGRQKLLTRLENWSDFELTSLENILCFRRDNGMVRNCHGDLHLGNIALIDDAVCLFDCIEFNDEFRWIDVMSEVAFVVMDLEERGLSESGWRFLNRYLERSGDYEGVSVLPFFLVYRALVRAKIDAIRLQDSSIGSSESSTAPRLQRDLQRCLAVADRDHDLLMPTLILMHGVSGSGKSYVSQHLLEKLPAIRVRSDVERKRMFGLAAEDRPDATTKTTMYSSDASHRTYDQLLYLADTLILSGYPVIIDATFLSEESRQPFLKMASSHNAKTFIVDCHAPTETLRDRVRRRASANRDASDADLTVLMDQLSAIDRPADSEASHVLRIDTSGDDPLNNAVSEIRQRLQAAGMAVRH